MPRSAPPVTDPFALPQDGLPDEIAAKTPLWEAVYRSPSDVASDRAQVQATRLYADGAEWVLSDSRRVVDAQGGIERVAADLRWRLTAHHAPIETIEASLREVFVTLPPHPWPSSGALPTYAWRARLRDGTSHTLLTDDDSVYRELAPLRLALADTVTPERAPARTQPE